MKFSKHAQEYLEAFFDLVNPEVANDNWIEVIKTAVQMGLNAEEARENLELGTRVRWVTRGLH